MEMNVAENDCFTTGTRRESRKTRSRSGRGEGSCKVYISMEKVGITQVDGR